MPLVQNLVYLFFGININTLLHTFEIKSNKAPARMGTLLNIHWDLHGVIRDGAHFISAGFTAISSGLVAEEASSVCRAHNYHDWPIFDC